MSFTEIYRIKNSLYCINNPVVIEASRLLFDDEKRKVLVQLKLAHFSSFDLSTCKVVVETFDVDGNSVETKEYSYLHVNAKKSQPFGDQEPIYLDKDAKSFKIRVSYAEFSNNEKITSDSFDDWKNEFLYRDFSKKLGNLKPIFDEQTNGTLPSLYEPDNKDGFMLCSCGAVVKDTESVCYKCFRNLNTEFDLLKQGKLKSLKVKKDNKKKRNILIAVAVGIIIIIAIIIGNYFLANPANKWIKTSAGWEYRNANRKKVTGLIKIDKQYYYFNNDGIMQTGWKDVNGKKYYFSDNGAAKTGWLNFDSKYYFFNKNTSELLRDTWITENELIGTNYNGIYWLGSDGTMVAGKTININGNNYEFDSQGKRIIKWTVKDIYFNTSANSKEKMTSIDVHMPVFCHYTVESDVGGTKANLGNITIFPNGTKSKLSINEYESGSTWYSSYASGIYTNPDYGATGNLIWQFFDSRNRLIGQGSVLMTRQQSTNQSQINTSTGSNENSSNKLLDGLATIDGKSYYIDKDGKAKKGWFQVGDDYYFFDEATGEMVTNKMRMINEKIYYFAPDGKMAKNTALEWKGIYYIVHADGECRIIDKSRYDSYNLTY